MVDLGVDVAVAPDGALDRLLDDVGHLVDNELGLKSGRPNYSQTTLPEPYSYRARGALVGVKL